MSMAVPLGVRIFNNWGRSFDVWVTRLVSDIQFRSVIPGGYANATLTLHNDQATSWTQVAQPLNRIQIVDLRSQEIAWEGRIDTVPRRTSDDTWELGCLGSMAYASDIQRPIFYIDGRVSNWAVGVGAVATYFSPTPNEDAQEIKFTPAAMSWAANHYSGVALWQRAESCGARIGRFDITYSGQSAVAGFRTGTDVRTGNLASTQTNVDLTAWNAGTIRKTNLIVTDFTSTDAQVVEVAVDITGTPTADGITSGTIGLPRIQLQRVDETGAKLQTAASYPNDYLTVEQIVRDVVGRFMVGAWRFSGNNTPYHGMVGSEGIYIDTSSTAEITNLTYYEGATAAQILGDLMAAQPNAYWALWESRYGATTDGNSDARFRFEWATWPDGWSYEATSVDGLEEQPDGGQLANFVFFNWVSSTRIPDGLVLLQEYWGTDVENQLLTDAQLVRAVTVSASEPMDATAAFDRAQEYFEDNQRTTNTGTLTVRRPIHAHDAGLNSNSGMSRMLDPWLIRPGKLIRITDIPPRSNSHTFAAAADAVIDTFSRTTVADWTTADTGQAWTNTGGSAADFSVSGGLGRHSVGTEDISRWSTIPSPGADFDVTLTLATDVTAAGGSQFGYLVGRFIDVSNSYFARIEFTTTATVALVIRKRLAGVETTLVGGTVSGLVHAANARFSVRLRARGSTLEAKVWLASASEPSTWNFTATDTDITAIGSVGVRSVVAGANTRPLPITMTFDNFTAVGLQTYAPELDGTVFRVVGTTYSSSDNSCVLELDRPPAWDNATQVLKSGEGSSNLVVRG